MSSIKLIRRGQPRAASSTPAVRAPRLGPDWWRADWQGSTSPIDVICERQVNLLREGWNSATNYAGDPDGQRFAEVHLDQALPLELWQGILSIPDRFLDPHGVVILRKVDDDGKPAVRVVSPQGLVIGHASPETLLDVNVWLERGAHWLLASCGVSVERIRALMNRELPRS